MNGETAVGRVVFILVLEGCNLITAVHFILLASVREYEAGASRAFQETLLRKEGRKEGRSRIVISSANSLYKDFNRFNLI